jgi:hypothetical protein
MNVIYGRILTGIGAIDRIKKHISDYTLQVESTEAAKKLTDVFGKHDGSGFFQSTRCSRTMMLSWGATRQRLLRQQKFLEQTKEEIQGRVV